MIKIYTDGGSVPNPGYGSWGFVVVKNNEIIYKNSGREMISTSNRMELTAVIKGLEYLKTKGIAHNIIVYTDSKYVKNGINDWIYTWMEKGWITSNRKSVKNQSLWRNLYELKELNFVGLKIEWIKGHNGDQYNEAADYLCNKELKEVYGNYDYEKDKGRIKDVYKKLLLENK